VFSHKRRHIKLARLQAFKYRSPLASHLHHCVRHFRDSELFPARSRPTHFFLQLVQPVLSGERRSSFFQMPLLRSQAQMICAVQRVQLFGLLSTSTATAWPALNPSSRCFVRAKNVRDIGGCTACPLQQAQSTDSAHRWASSYFSFNTPQIDMCLSGLNSHMTARGSAATGPKPGRSYVFTVIIPSRRTNRSAIPPPKAFDQVAASIATITLPSTDHRVHLVDKQITLARASSLRSGRLFTSPRTHHDISRRQYNDHVAPNRMFCSHDSRTSHSMYPARRPSAIGGLTPPGHNQHRLSCTAASNCMARRFPLRP